VGALKREFEADDILEPGDSLGLTDWQGPEFEVPKEGRWGPKALFPEFYVNQADVIPTELWDDSNMPPQHHITIARILMKARGRHLARGQKTGNGHIRDCTQQPCISRLISEPGIQG
jgi:hypothetical protein